MASLTGTWCCQCTSLQAHSAFSAMCTVLSAAPAAYSVLPSTCSDCCSVKNYSITSHVVQSLPNRLDLCVDKVWTGMSTILIYVDTPLQTLPTQRPNLFRRLWKPWIVVSIASLYAWDGAITTGNMPGGHLAGLCIGALCKGLRLTDQHCCCLQLISHCRYWSPW